MTREFRNTFYAQAYGKSVSNVGDLFGQLRGFPPSEDATAPIGHWEAMAQAAITAATRCRRLTPTEPYVQHRGYPSPRSVFAAAAHVESEAIRLTVDLARVPTAYGTLRPPLAWAEAGHLAATIQAFAQWNGHATRVQTHRDGADMIEARLVPMATSGTLRELLATVAAGGRDLEGIVDQRTSNPQDTFGQSGLTQAAAVSAELSSIAALASQSIDDLLPASASVDVQMLPRPQLRAQTPNDNESRGAGRPAPHYPAALGVQFSTCPMHWETGPPSLIHFVAGWIAQWVCLGAARLTCAARPTRNFNESVWAAEARLPLGDIPVYQIWCERRAASLFERSVTA